MTTPLRGTIRCSQHIHVDGSGGACGPGKDGDGKGDGNSGGGGGKGGISTVASESSSCALVSGAYAAPAPSSSNPPAASGSSNSTSAATTIRGAIISKSNAVTAVNAPDASVNGSGTMSTLMSGTMTHVTGSVWPGGTPFGSSGTDPTRSIHLLHLLGSGSFGRVYYGERRRALWGSRLWRPVLEFVLRVWGPRWCIAVHDVVDVTFPCTAGMWQGQAVAIKIIPHSEQANAKVRGDCPRTCAVENECSSVQHVLHTCSRCKFPYMVYCAFTCGSWVPPIRRAV